MWRGLSWSDNRLLRMALALLALDTIQLLDCPPPVPDTVLFLTSDKFIVVSCFRRNSK